MSQNESEFNDSNSVFVNSVTGQDTNDGIRNSPYRSVTKALDQNQTRDGPEIIIVFLSAYEPISDESNGISIESKRIKFVNELDNSIVFDMPFNIACCADKYSQILLRGNFIFNDKITFNSSDNSSNSISFKKEYYSDDEPFQIILNGGLEINNVDAYVDGLDFKLKGLSSVGSDELWISGCTFNNLECADNMPTNDTCAISVMDCTGDVHIERCYINWDENINVSSHSTWGIYLHNTSGYANISYNTISNADFNAIQITNLSSDVTISNNKFINWDFDNDHFSDKDSNLFKNTSGGRAIRINAIGESNISIMDNSFLKDYGNAPQYINSHEYEDNLKTVPPNAYDDGNILKISTDSLSNISSFSFYNNTLESTDSDRINLSFSSENSTNYLLFLKI